MRITAAVLRTATDPFTIEELELDDPRPGEVLVRIVGAGLCHTDLLATNPAYPFPHPIVLGHEGAGVVAEVGAGVTSVKRGDRVVLSFDSCGVCDLCRRGAPQYCDSFYLMNLFGRRLDGSTTMRTLEDREVTGHWFGQSSFASHALASERNVVKVGDESLALELLGPLGCGLQTGAGAVLNSIRPEVGDQLVVFGCGGVGLAAVMAAKVAGCRSIVAVDLHDSRLHLATEVGATHTVNAGTRDDVAGAIREITGGGADATFDTTGVAGVIRTAVDVLRPLGTCVLVAAGDPEITIDASSFIFGKRIKGCFEGDAVPQHFIPRLLDLHAQGRFPLEKLTATYPLDRINDAVHDSESGATVKPILLP
jgi:aryl-alcohol dehydrogenase